MIAMQASSFDRISPTALLVAYARQFTDIPYSQELARLVNAQMIVEQILGEQSEPPVDVVVVLEGRYKAINQVMIQYEATQILEIASGLLPRGLALSQNPDITDEVVIIQSFSKTTYNQGWSCGFTLLRK